MLSIRQKNYIYCPDMRNCLLILCCLFTLVLSAQPVVTPRKGVKKVNVDSLRIPTHFYYLADLKVDQIVKLIMTDSVRPSDNYITFRLLDSINSPNKATRADYLPVFLKIIDQADGALAEAMGDNCLAFAQKYAYELFNFNPPPTNDQLEMWAELAATELYFNLETGTARPALSSFLRKFHSASKKCTADGLVKSAFFEAKFRAVFTEVTTE